MKRSNFASTTAALVTSTIGDRASGIQMGSGTDPQIVLAFSRGSYGQAVVGESFYMKSFMKLLRKRRREFNAEKELRTVAVLQRDNVPGHPEAIAVTIDGLKLGHIPALEAANYHHTIDTLTAQGRTLGANARVWIGKDWSDEDQASISLDCKGRGLTVPANTHQGIQVPPGRRSKLKIEEPGPVGRLVAAGGHEGGQTLAWVTLRRFDPPKGKPKLTTHLDDWEIATCTPAVSASLLPLVDWAAGQGYPLVAACELSGNPISAAGVLLYQPASEIPASWFATAVPEASPIDEPEFAATAAGAQQVAPQAPETVGDSTQPAALVRVRPPAVPANWHPDPTGRHQHRFWDGNAWTANVLDNGNITADPI